MTQATVFLLAIKRIYVSQVSFPRGHRPLFADNIFLLESAWWKRRSRLISKRREQAHGGSTAAPYNRAWAEKPQGAI